METYLRIEIECEKKKKEKKWVIVFRRRKLEIILSSSEGLGSLELLRYALKKRDDNKNRKEKKNIRAIRV